MFEKRHGKNSAWTATFYDKQKRIAQMRQGKSLTPVETDLIRGNVRFDVTAHGLGIMELIGKARRRLEQLRKQSPTYLEDLPAKEFLSETPKQTAWWSERAVYVLSHTLRLGVMRRDSFAKWLIPEMMNEILRLSSIVKCTAEGLRKFAELDHHVATTWHNVAKFETAGWIAQLEEASGFGKTEIYTLRKDWLAEYKIDIAIPYAFYRDLEFFGPNSLTKPESRSALLRSLSRRDGEETLRLLENAADNFFEQMAEVVGATISSQPTLLQPKIAGAAVPAFSKENTAFASKKTVHSRSGLLRPNIKKLGRGFSPDLVKAADKVAAGGSKKLGLRGRGVRGLKKGGSN